jgi:hypothetical protein
MIEKNIPGSNGAMGSAVHSQREWLLRWPAVSGFLKQLMPRSWVDGLHRIRARVLSRDLPRDAVFEQSREDALASGSMSIVVPIHDAPAITRRCLASLERYAPESEIILVDDASSLTETSAVIQEFSSRNGWKVIRHEKPLGHSEACRAGSRLSKRPYLCLLNSDTVVTPWCWNRVKQAFDHDENVGIAVPSTSCAGTLQNLTFASHLRHDWNDNQICAFAHRVLTNSPQPMVVDLPWVSGFALFIRRSLWEALGGFDQNLPDYGNEVELCERSGIRGFRNVWVRNSYIHHFGQQSYTSAVGTEEMHARSRAAELYIKNKPLPGR